MKYLDKIEIFMKYIESNSLEYDNNTQEYKNIVSLFSALDPITKRYVLDIIMEQKILPDDIISQVRKWSMGY